MKTFLAALTILAALSSPSLGQSQKVIELDTLDVATAKQLAKNLADAQGALEKFRSAVRDKYLAVVEGSKDAGSCSAPTARSGVSISTDGSGWVTTGSLTIQGCETAEEKTARLVSEKKLREEQNKYAEEHPRMMYREGWACGSFEFSDDYKFIVPVVEKPVFNSGTITIPAPLTWR